MIARVLAMALALSAPLLLGSAAPADAQTLGPLRWQLAPYCNVLTLTATFSQFQYTLDGLDNECGGAGGAVTGTAFLTPQGHIGIGLTIIRSAGAVPTHVSVALNPSTLSGSWTDSGGLSGTFLFNPPPRRADRRDRRRDLAAPRSTTGRFSGDWRPAARPARPFESSARTAR